MVTEPIIVTIDDYDLKIIEANLNAMARETRILKKGISDANLLAKHSGINLDDLPTVNRDMRLLIGSLNIPGTRAALSTYFQIRRGVRAEELRRRAAGIAELDPEKAAEMRLQSLLGQAALVTFIVKTVYDTITKFVEDERQANIDLENMFQEGLDISFNQTRLLVNAQTGFATRWAQLQEMMQTEGFLTAIKDMVVGSLPALLQGDYGGAANYPGEPRDRWTLFEDIRSWLETRQAESGSGDMIPGESIIGK